MMMIMEALRDNRADTNDKTMVAPEAIRAVVVVSDLDHKVGIVDLHHRPLLCFSRFAPSLLE